jgi:hypothetical protein
MMKLFIVFVKFTQPGTAGSRWSVRYLDSQWASESHARDRKKELEDSLDRAGILSQEYNVAIMCGRVIDAEATNCSDAPEAA